MAVVVAAQTGSFETLQGVYAAEIHTQCTALSCRGRFLVLRAKSHFQTARLWPGTPSMFGPDTA